jgi:hypothetical protein
LRKIATAGEQNRFDILLNKIVNNQAPPEVKLIDPLTLVTKENVDSYGENWKKSLKK